jgi:type VI secretion system secreted protein Hcp
MKTINKISRSFATIATATTLLLTPIASYAAVDMFLQLDGIQGEAQDKANAGQIDVLAWSEGLSQSGTTHMGSGGGAGKVSVQDLSLTKYIDSSSPALRQRVSSGQHIATATLLVRKAGEGQKDYFKIELKDIIVTSVSAGGSGGEDRLTENVTLNFAEIRWTYTPPVGAPISVGWNVAENKPL